MPHGLNWPPEGAGRGIRPTAMQDMSIADSPTEMSGYGSTNDVATTVEQVGRIKTERQRRARDVNCTRSGASSGAHSPHD